MEYNCHIAQIPLVNETTVEFGGRELTPGGKALGTARALAALGAPHKLCSCIGNDRYGELILKYCKENGISTSYLYTDPKEPTAFRMHLIEQNGAVRSAFYPGAFNAIRHSFIEDAFACRPDAVCATLDMPPERLEYIADTADEQDACLFIDAGKAAGSYPISRISKCEAFIVDATEAYRFSKIIPDSMDSCLRAAVRLAGIINAKYIIIKLKDRGVFIYDGKYCGMASQYGKDPFAAKCSEEAFIASLAYTYMFTKNMEAACKYASVSAAICAENGGGLEALPTADGIADFCKDNNID